MTTKEEKIVFNNISRLYGVDCANKYFKLVSSGKYNSFVALQQAIAESNTTPDEYINISKMSTLRFNSK